VISVRTHFIGPTATSVLNKNQRFGDLLCLHHEGQPIAREEFSTFIRLDSSMRIVLLANYKYLAVDSDTFCGNIEKIQTTVASVLGDTCLVTPCLCSRL
jgi:hypothetical protein